METINTGQAEAWNGYEGKHWADHHDRYNAINFEFNPTLLDLVRPDDRVLDIGCGAGQLTRLAAGRATGAMGLDLSEPMLARARQVAAEEGIDNVTFVQGDAQVFAFTREFDVAVSRFGIMFFADPVAAFANLGNALRPGGRLAMLSMRSMAEHDLAEVIGAAEQLPWMNAEADDAGPLSMSDPGVVRGILEQAGYTDITTDPVDADQVWGRDAADAGAFLADWGPVRFTLANAGPEVADLVRTEFTESMRRFETPDGVRLRGAAWRIQAVRA
ncbi:class I SAM-dependent methyltransferase [Actinokineospora xionganensis]|uniref:Methyltransferase domain-containing protein n=1 Tax=Actinokineospora xionganensis TaxID=2684470 RepID=A0ABR7LE57_9PSEU|nr:class I SAM-dependent methyltransferase [Actinokineospora xionganensis]MBC6450681.1 methyltransferase domain-containing protein [Actinokineospora xionganensis]